MNRQTVSSNVQGRSAKEHLKTVMMIHTPHRRTLDWRKVTHTPVRKETHLSRSHLLIITQYNNLKNWVLFAQCLSSLHTLKTWIPLHENRRENDHFHEGRSSSYWLTSTRICLHHMNRKQQNCVMSTLDVGLFDKYFIS